MSDNVSKKSKELVMGTIIYAIGSFGTKILSFLIVPLYTYYISPAEMGDYDIMLSTINLITPLITLQISDGAYAWMIRNQKETKLYISTVYKFVLCASVLSVAVIGIVNTLVPIQHITEFALILVFGRWMQTLQKLLRGIKNQKLFVLSGIVYTSVFLSLNFVQITILNMGVAALYQSNIIATVTVVVLILLLEPKLRDFTFKGNTAVTRNEMLKFSVPLIPNRLNWWVMDSSDRYIIRFFIGSAGNGIFAVAHKFPSVLQLVFNIFYESWQDMSIADKDEDGGKFYTEVFKKYSKFAFASVIFLIPFTRIVIQTIMHSSYHDAALYTSFLYIATVFQAFSTFVGVGYLKNNRTADAAKTSIYGAVANFIIHVVCVKFIGLYAAALSTLIGFMVMFFVRFKQTKETMGIIVNWKHFISLFMISLAEAVICINSNRIVDVGLSVVGFVLFFVLNKDLIQPIFKKITTKIKH